MTIRGFDTTVVSPESNSYLPNMSSYLESTGNPSLPSHQVSQETSSSSHSPSSRLIFVGSGPSTGIPRIGCLMKRPIECRVCADALKPHSRNRRRNPSILISYQNKANILIDCGKSFREAFLELMIRREGITHIDAVILTHAHADAFLGLDDLREFCWEQKSSFTKTTSYVHPNRPGVVVDSVIPILLRKQDLPIVAAAFPYLVDSSMATGSGFVARLAFKTFEEIAIPLPSSSYSSSSTTSDVPPSDPSTTSPSSSSSASTPSLHFEVLGLRFQTFTLEHGHNSTCTGFRFGNVVYLSDLSGLSEEVRSSIITSGPQIEILIIDALHPTEPNRSHYCLPQTLDEIRRLKPRKTYLIGMAHAFEYFETNKRLSKLKETEGLDVEMSFDTLSLPIQL